MMVNCEKMSKIKDKLLNYKKEPLLFILNCCWIAFCFWHSCPQSNPVEGRLAILWGKTAKENSLTKVSKGNFVTGILPKKVTQAREILQKMDLSTVMLFMLMSVLYIHWYNSLWKYIFNHIDGERLLFLRVWTPLDDAQNVHPKQTEGDISSEIREKKGNKNVLVYIKCHLFLLRKMSLKTS